MGWRFWRRDPTPAEVRLAELSAATGVAAPGAATAAVPTPRHEGADTDPWEHLIDEVATIPGLEHLADEEPTFGLQVEAAAAGPDGTQVLRGPADGTVAAGDVVALFVTPAPARANSTVAFDESRLGPAGSRAVAASLQPTTAHATVVTVTLGSDTEPTELVVGGLQAEVSTGSVVLR